MSFGDENPTFEELMEVVQRQQEVIELFEQKIEAFRIECVKLTEENEKKSEIIKIMEMAESLMKTEIQSLRNENDEKQKGHGTREEKSRDLELETVGELRMKCREINFQLEMLKTQYSATEVELETHKKNSEFLRAEFEEEKLQRKGDWERHTVIMETMEKELQERCGKLQESLAKSQVELAQKMTELEIKEHREKQLETLYLDLMEETEETRKEKSAILVKCSSMTAEIAGLKTIVRQLKARLPRNEYDIEDMNKLLGDQRHLIAALREETKLLARKLEIDSRDYRQNIKVLKQEKRDLEQRIEMLLRV